MSAVMYSLYKPWCDKIFSGEKTLEFRTKLPKNLKTGTKIYFYETKKHNGSGKVVGECIVSDIISVLNNKGQWPTCGCYPFLEYYFANIVGDLELASYIGEIRKEFENKFENYKNGYIFRYMMSEENLENIRKTGHPLDTWKLFDKSLINKILEDIETADKFIDMCDEWLSSIGFYNEICESYYKWGLVLSEIKKYDKPIPVSNFINIDGNFIKSAPQSYCYVKY